MTTLIPDKAVVLFLGDGTTDHGRDRENPADLGSGYALMCAAWFSALYPQKQVRFLNRGVAGDRIKNLLERWETDTLDAAPTCVSILIGVNNTRRRFDQNDPTPVEAFERDYRAFLQQTAERLNPQFIMLDPFLLPLNEQQQLMRPDLDEKIEVVGRLAREFNAIHVPLDAIFADAAQKREASFWLFDGVLLTPAGAGLIAQSWLKAVGAI